MTSEPRPRRRLRRATDHSAGRPVPPPAEAPTDPRVVGLLQQIAELRLSAATNLTLAAAAMDAARPDIATELIEAQQRDVADLRGRAALLLGLDGPLGERTRRAVLHDAAVEEFGLLQRARVPATKSLRKQPSSGVLLLPPRREQNLSASRWSASGALLAIAATIAVALLRPLAPPAPATPDSTSVAVVASLNKKVQISYGQLLETARPRTPTSDVEQSAQRLHVDLAALLPEAAKDPVAANRLLGVLRAERVLLSAQSPGALDAFQVEAVRIITQLRRTADPQVLAALPEDDIGVVGALPSQVGDAVAAFSRVAPPAAAKGATTGSAVGSDGASVGSGAGGSASSAPVPVPAVAPDPPVKAPTPVLTDPGSGSGGSGTGTGSSGSSGGGTSPVLPGPPPPVDPVPLLPQLPQLPSALSGDLPQH